MSSLEPWADRGGAATVQADVAMAARILARAGLVHAFGHVSARSGAEVMLTPTRPPLPTLQAADVIRLRLRGTVSHGDPSRLPLEAPMHLAIYRGRPDVNAIARVHGSALAAWAARGVPPPMLHGFGAIVEPVAAWTDPDLIADEIAAGAVAAALGATAAIVLRGNGGLAVGTTLAEAAARAWCLEDRCAVAERAGDHGVPLSQDEFERRRRWFGPETSRLWAWLQATYGDST